MASKPPFVGEKVKVSEVFDLQMGKTPSRKNLSYWNNGDYDWVSIKDLGSYDRFVGRTRETISELGRVESGIKPVPANTLLMSFKLSIGKTAITTRETYTNEAIMAFLDRGYYDFDLGYMWHQFRSKDWMVGTNVAVMGKTLNKQTLGNAIINLPVMSDQLMIARQLDEVHAQIDLTKNCLRMLDHLIKSRFVEMFGDPAEPGIYPLAKLGDLYQVKSSKRIYSREQTKSGVSFYRLADIGSLVDGIPPRQELFISKERYEELKNNGMVPVPNDILVTARGTLGRCYIIKDEDEFYFQDGMITWLSQTQDSPLSAWLVELFANKAFVFDLSNNCSGTTVKYLSISDLADKRISVPPLELQQQFVDFVTQVDKSRFVVQQQIEKLQTLYDSLAQEYFGD